MRNSTRFWIPGFSRLQTLARTALYTQATHRLKPKILFAPLLCLLLLMAFTATTLQAAPTPGSIGGCALFPANSVFNTKIVALPTDVRSADYVNSIGANTPLHPDFGTVYNGGPIGIPFIAVPTAQPLVLVVFDEPDESDPGPYPIPPDAPIEFGSDRHVLVVHSGPCKLYEMGVSMKQDNGSNVSWTAFSGAVWDLNSNALRPDTWTSADAAGLPMLPLLVRYDDVQTGQINHAVRFTAGITRRAYVWPGRHYASSNTQANRPPLGQRFRLKALVNVEAMSISAEAKVIFRALQEYGMFLADNGSNWYISGAPDSRWNDEELVSAFDQLKGSDFEAVDESSLMVNKDSGEARQMGQPGATATPTATVTPSISPTPTLTPTPFAPTHWVYLPLARRP